MDPVFAILIVVALLLGALLGYLLGGRPVAEWKQRHSERDTEARRHEENFKMAGSDLGKAQIELATLKANAENFDKQIALLNEAREQLITQFKAAGGEVLGHAQEEFLKRAAERFGVSEKANKEAVANLLEPVSHRFKSYEEQVVALEKARIDGFGQLAGLIQSMKEGQESVRREAARLGNSLRSAPKASGRWGELHVENVLEKCGLSDHVDFRSEAATRTDDGLLRPDFVVNVPGNRKLIIDAKNIWKSYDEAYATDDEPTRVVLLKKHVQAVREHVTALSSKSYYSHWEGSAEYVVLFIPGEHLLYAALQQDRDLWNFAFEKDVLLATPTNLVAIAKTVARVWQQVGLEKEAKEIGRVASDLYDSLAKTQEDLIKVGVHLGRAVNSYNDFAKTYEGNTLSRARRLADMHVKIGKRTIGDETPLIETTPRHTA